jgi:hypothetical protein
MRVLPIRHHYGADKDSRERFRVIDLASVSSADDVDGKMLSLGEGLEFIGGNVGALDVSSPGEMVALNIGGVSAGL